LHSAADLLSGPPGRPATGPSYCSAVTGGRGAGRYAVEAGDGERAAVWGLVTRAIAFTIDAALVNLIAIVVAGAVGLMLSVLSVPDWLRSVLVALGGALFLAWGAGYIVLCWSTTGQTPGSSCG
jgi:hypothetical protein